MEKSEQGPRFVTFRQLITTCASSAIIAVIAGWLLARADVWALQAAIDRLSAVVREIRVNQNQTVHVGEVYDRQKVIENLAKKIGTGEIPSELYARTMRRPATPHQYVAGNGTGERRPGGREGSAVGSTEP